MRIYKLTDNELDLFVGYCICFERENSWIIELSTELDQWTCPLLFQKLVSDGKYTVPRELSYKFIKGRVIPPGRQNISEILKNSRLTYYNEQKLLELSKGICSQDSISFKVEKEMPQFLVDRMRHTLVDCTICEDYSLLCFFADDTVKKIDLKQFSDVKVISKIISNEVLYKSGVVCAGGYHVTFNNSLDLDASFLYDNGMDIPLSYSDFVSFINNNVLDSNEACNLLECTRQNLSYFVKTSVVIPIKENEKGYLYLKGNVLSSKW